MYALHQNCRAEILILTTIDFCKINKLKFNWHNCCYNVYWFKIVFFLFFQIVKLHVFATCLLENLLSDVNVPDVQVIKASFSGI